jgi:hypothetical protein
VAFVGGSALFQLVALGLPAAGSVEAPIPIRIVFDAPPDCSTIEAFYQGVRSRTDRVRRAETGETGTELGVRVTKTAGKVHGELNLTGEHGESDRRVVDGETCDEVVEALSLTAALALDPTARVSRAAAPPVPAPLASVPKPCPPPPLVPTFPNSFELALHARGAAAQVVTPDVSFGGSIGVSFAPVASAPSPSFGIALGYLGNDLLAVPDDASTHLTIATLSVCPIHFPTDSDSFFVTPCIVARGGFLEARGLGVSNPAWAVRTYWSLGVEATLAFGLGGGFFAELAPALDFPLVKRRFVAGRPPGPIGETPVASPALGAGIGYHFQ